MSFFNVVPKTASQLAPRTIEAEPYEIKITKKRICVFDTETDPFGFDNEGAGVVVKPFTAGFYDGSAYYDFWGDNCIDQFFAHLATSYEGEELLIYAHNGGNFDFYFCMDYVDEGSQPFIIGGRLARMMFQGQEFRDSYSLIPVAMAAYEKTEIDYDKFTVPNREANKKEIRAYQKDDCLFLYDLVSNAHKLFGDKLTMASVALPMLRSYHGFETVNEKTDTSLRDYYFGGRCECFEVGDLRPSPGKEFYIYDVNSMYPHVMASAQHPVSGSPKYQSRITDKTAFATIDATSYGALPVRGDSGGLEFPHGRRTYHASIHEIAAGLDTGLLRIHKVIKSVYFDVMTTFDDFINTFYNMRMEARANNDKLRDLFYKLVMNSSYGKFAQDPRKYEQYMYNPVMMPSPIRCNECRTKREKHNDLTKCAICEAGISAYDGWYIHTKRGENIIYARPSSRLNSFGFYNVATAASITGAARALLLRGISGATRPLYCDTDSIICEGLDNVPMGDKQLGAWKTEAVGDRCAIAGKKLYAVFNDGEAIKSASKGVKLTPAEIARVCAGEVIEYANPVPKFHLDGSVDFTTRRVSRTGKVLAPSRVSPVGIFG